jgi:hypothetical protein
MGGTTEGPKIESRQSEELSRLHIAQTRCKSLAVSSPMGTGAHFLENNSAGS